MKRPQQLHLFHTRIAAPCRHCGWPARTAATEPATGRVILEYCTECGWVEFPAEPRKLARLIPMRSKTA